MHTPTEPIPNPTCLPNVYTLVHKNYISDLSSPILLKLNSPQCSSPQTNFDHSKKSNKFESSSLNQNISAHLSHAQCILRISTMLTHLSSHLIDFVCNSLV